MKELRWNETKNKKLKKERGVSYEKVISSKFIGVEEHEKRANQVVLLFEYEKYIWMLPCVEEKDYYFVKTMFPSRKKTKECLGR